MRCAIAQPCCGSTTSALRMSMSSVPCSKSVGGGIFPSTFDNRLHYALVGCQGERTSGQCGGDSFAGHADTLDVDASDAANSLILGYPRVLFGRAWCSCVRGSC